MPSLCVRNTVVIPPVIRLAAHTVQRVGQTITRRPSVSHSSPTKMQQALQALASPGLQRAQLQASNAFHNARRFVEGHLTTLPPPDFVPCWPVPTLWAWYNTRQLSRISTCLPPPPLLSSRAVLYKGPTASGERRLFYA